MRGAPHSIGQAGPARQALSAGALAIAAGYLEAAARSRARLDDPDDTEALHDFRVALRHLRAWRRALGDAFDERTTRRIRQLAKVARASGPARDAEVLLDELRDLGARLPPRLAPGLAALEDVLRAERDHAYEALRADGLPRFDRVAPKLEAALARGRDAGALRGPTLGAEVARAISEERRERSALGEVVERADPNELHALRIATKRLRYLAEPFRERIAAARLVVRTLARLQRTLGELHDLDVLAGWLRAQSARLAADRTTSRAVETLARRVVTRRKLLLRRLHRLAAPPHLATLDARLDRLVRALGSGPVR